MDVNIDMSLDDIIKRDKISVGRGRGRRGNKFAARAAARASTRGRKPTAVRKIGATARQMKPGLRRGRSLNTSTGRNVPDKWLHDKFIGDIKSTSIMISNLDYGVSDHDIRELFAEFGPLKKAAVHYDSSGRSLGKAEVVFAKAVDAIKATKKYNGVALDGRPMNIQPLVSPTAKTNIALRIGNVAKLGAKVQRGQRAVRGATRGRRGGRVGRGGQRRPGGRKVPTAEELDADLDAYANNMS